MARRQLALGGMDVVQLRSVTSLPRRPLRRRILTPGHPNPATLLALRPAPLPLPQYLFFALLYLTQPNQCVGGIMRFSHAMWFSVYTAATLGG